MRVYDLYWSAGSASLAPQMVLEWSRAPYRTVEIDLRSGANQLHEYTTINPTGYVPALRCSDGTIMAEAAAITLYLAERHAPELVPLSGDPARPPFLRW